MRKQRAALFVLALMPLGNLSSLAVAQVASSAPARAGLTIARPLALERLQNLEFGGLAVNGAGTATVSATTGALTTTGGVSLLAGSPQAARFRLTTSRATAVLIRVPTGTVILTRQGGTQTISITNWQFEGSAIRLFGSNGSVTFGVGGRLNIPANQAEGVYSGSFDVTVNYL